MPKATKVTDIVRAVHAITGNEVIGVVKRLDQIVVFELNSGNELDREITCSAIIGRIPFEKVPSEWQDSVLRIRQQLDNPASVQIPPADPRLPANSST